MAVVKADAYGHGMLKVLPALRDADGYGVATVEEAKALRRAGETKPVMVFQGFRTPKQLEECIAGKLWPVIHDEYQLEMMAHENLANLSCWVKFDTGMGRVGLDVAKVTEAYQRLRATNVKVVGIMSHLACADRPQDLTNTRQLRELQSISWPDVALRSMANSAALLSRKDSRLDWVRPGLMLYGASPFSDAHTPNNVSHSGSAATEAESSCAVPYGESIGLQPAMRVTAPVIAVRQLERGQRVGYGARYRCEKPTRVAVVGAGYGDGYPRSAPDLASAMLGNLRCPIIGRISMDSMVVDISDLTVPPPIDYPVTLWGHSQLRVEEIAQLAGTIPYELLCSVRGQRHWIDVSNKINVSRIDQDVSTN